MTPKELREKAKELERKAAELEAREAEKLVGKFGKILLKHYREGFTNCSIEILKKECGFKEESSPKILKEVKTSPVENSGNKSSEIEDEIEIKIDGEE